MDANFAMFRIKEETNRKSFGDDSDQENMLWKCPMPSSKDKFRTR